MNQPYLEITYRRGKPFAAYLYLPRRAGECVARSKAVNELFVIDRAADERPIGVEIVEPSGVTAEMLNDLLTTLDQPRLPSADLAPLQAA